jgi:DNA polymerase
MAQCSQCALRAGCNRVVPGEGNPDATTLVLAEGPGEDEDKQGRPLVGRAGSFFRQCYQQAGLNLKDVFLSNAVKCRPPNNRAPLPVEEDACWTWTKEIIKTVQPKIIVTMGDHALHTLARHMGFSKKLGQLTITKLAGKPIYLYEYKCYIYPTIHPSFAIRRSAEKINYLGYFEYLAQAWKGWVDRP